MKKVFLIHCWDGTPEDGWYPWIANKLRESNVEVIRLVMPNTESPIIEKWVETLDCAIDQLNEDIYFIGHSIGCQTILRYLETKSPRKVGGMVLVAPWLELLPEATEDEESKIIAEPWLNKPIDFEKVNQFTNNVNCIFSNDDYFVPLNQIGVFENKLSANCQVVKNKGHISADDNVFMLDEILDMCNKMLKNKA